MSSNRNIGIQAEFVTAVFAGDADTIRRLADPGFELIEGSAVPFAGTYRGADGFLEFLGIFNDTFEIEKLAPVRAYEAEDPDYIAFEFDLRGIHRATGKMFESTLIEVWIFRDGKVLSIKPHYFNSPLAG